MTDRPLTETIKDNIDTQAKQINDMSYGTVKIIIKKGKMILLKVEGQYLAEE